MRFVEDFADYRVIDTTSGEKLELWKDVMLVRPDPQIIWNTEKSSNKWRDAHARYHRSNKGGGEWEYNKKIPESWVVGYKGMKFKVSPTGFKHTGLFPEQSVNWHYQMEKIKSAGREIKVLNMFAYTGGATIACAKAGAKVTHVDASKGMTAWARENAKLTGLKDDAVRWIVDDCAKFVAREIRRGNKYDAVIMDPPSYGRGPGGEIWRLEDSIYELLELCKGVLSDNPLFFMLNSYTTGLSVGVMSYLLSSTVGEKFDGSVSADEIGVKVESTGLILPCGNTAIWEAK